MNPEPVPSRTVAIVLAAGLGTRMKSRRAQGPPRTVRPADARLRPRRGSGRDGRPTAGRLLPADRGRPRRLRGSGRLRAPGRATGHGDALLAALSALPADVRRDPRGLSATCRWSRRSCSRPCSTFAATTTAAIALVSVDTVDPGRLGRIVRDEDGQVERIVEAQGRDRGRARGRRDQRRPVRDRRRLAAPPDRRPRRRRRRPASCT